MEAFNYQPIKTIKNCLNPYYNGRYSWSVGVLHIHIKNLVLILIIMEDTHGEYVYKPTWPLSTS